MCDLPLDWTIMGVCYSVGTMKKPTPPPLLLVTWDDAGTDDGWQLHGDYKPLGPLICYTVGYLLHKDKQSIEVCQTWSQDQTGARWRIPMGMVVSIKKLQA